MGNIGTRDVLVLPVGAERNRYAIRDTGIHGVDTMVREQELPDATAERDVVELMRQTMREEGEPEFWARLFTRDQESLPLASELNKHEIEERLRLHWFAAHFGQDWLRELLDWDLALRVSLKRKGRKEAVH